VTEVMPEAMNDVTSLSTSESHSETVGLSATGGYAQGAGNGATGSVSANWSDTWGWEQTSTVNISDWASANQETGQVNGSGPSVTYQYTATGGTSDTYLSLKMYQYPTYTCNQCLLHTPVDVNTQFNALQQSDMTST